MKKIKKSYEKWYIYLIFQVTFIFLTQIYYNMNFITLSSNFITRFPWYFKINLHWLLLEDNFLAHKKMHISEYACKTCLKKWGILLKCRETFEKFLTACQHFYNTGLPQFFFKDFWQLYLKNINFLAKTKRCLYAEFYEFKTKMTGEDKQNHIFQKSKSYEISSTDIYTGEDLEFIIQVFY